MPRFSNSLPFKTGLMLVAMLATIPSSLHAEPKPQSSTARSVAPAVIDINKQPVKASPTPAATPASSTNSSKIPTASQQPPVKPTIATGNDRQPVEAVVTLTIKLNEKRVYVYKGDKAIANYPVAIGKKGWETPTGEWQVMEKIKNPGWTSFKNGQVIKAGRDNPLGERWIGFWTDGQDVIGFHGTTNLKSIGTAASHGCVRMSNRDVKALFPLVKVGTTVKVVNE